MNLFPFQRDAVDKFGIHAADLTEAHYKFLAKVDAPNDNNCCLWNGYTDEDGYGQLWVKVDGVWKSTRAHRWSYILFKGPIPKGYEIDHKCFVRRCVNSWTRPIDHLEAVTLLENRRRATERYYGLFGKNTLTSKTSATRCKRGHELNEENTYIAPRGWKECRICRYEAVKRSRSK